MAVISSSSQSFQVHHFPQNFYIDAVRWLPQLSAFHHNIILATFDPESSTSSLQTLNLSFQTSNSDSDQPQLTLQSSLTTPSRITSLKTSQNATKPLIAASTFSGSLLLYRADLVNGSLNFVDSVPEKGFHSGRVAGIDVSENGSEFVSVGEDGRINLVSSVGGKLSCRRVFDSNGLLSYGAVKWASPVEFVSGGLGFGLQWWDQRRPGGSVSQFKGNCRSRGTTTGIVHSIDVHPSRKHTCLAGGSSGTVFAWDLRWQNQPIMLAGVGTSDSSTPPPSESDVWEVHFDNYTNSSNYGNNSESRVLPAMICSEDGILAVIQQGEEPIELLAEPCAINGFDIDRQNPSDIVCSLEWESIAVLTRS